MRKTLEELEEIKNKLGVDTLWSYSRIGTYKSDKFSYYLKYIKHIKPDRNDCIYATIGSECHDLLEDAIEGKRTKESCIAELDNKLVEYYLAGLKYIRSDEEKNKNVSLRYENNIRHFFQNFNLPKYKCIIEPFILTNLGKDKNGKGIYFVGYIDCMYGYIDSNKEQHINIIDFKTSTRYTGQDLIDHSQQLLIYCKAIHDKTNIPYSHIHLKFEFLKYMTINVKQSKGTIKPTIVERYKAIQSIQSPIKSWLKKSSANLDETNIEILLDQAIRENKLDCLPEDVKDKFTLEDCYVDVPYTENDINILIADIEKTINEIEDKTTQYYATSNEEERVKIFWEDVSDDYSFFMANLSEYSAKLHLPYQKYLKDKGLIDNDNDNKPEITNTSSDTNDINQLLNDLGISE